MNTIETLKAIYAFSDAPQPVDAMYCLGRINGLVTALLSDMESGAQDTDADSPPDAPARNAAPAAPARKTRYIRSADIMDYIWSCDGSVRMEYMLRDLYHNRKGAEKQATTTLSRMESIADVTVDRDENGKIVIVTARRMPKD